MKRSEISQRGSAMVELAIMVPIMVLVVVSMIDISFLYRDKQIISDAVRQGAREAARSSAYCPTCDYDPSVSGSLSCVGASSTDITVGTMSPGDMAEDTSALGSVEVLAKRSTYRYLKLSGLDPNEWIVTVSNPMPLVSLSSGDPLQVVQVNIERNLATGSGCIICAAAGRDAKPVSSARFGLEKECV